MVILSELTHFQTDKHHISSHLWVLAWDLQIPVLHFEYQVHGGMLFREGR